jgi:hypothetical protein
MFNLEQSIAEWRKQMFATGIKSPVPLEELESHLREDIAQQMQSGLSAQRAFEIAVKKIGQASELKKEFKKISAPMKIPQTIKLAGVICAVVAAFCPLFLVLPLLSDLGLSVMTKVFALAALAVTIATIVLSWKYNHKFLPVIRNQRLRRAVGIMCYGGCLLWIRFGIFHVPPAGLHPRNFLLPLFVFGLEWTVMAILGGVGHGLEKAAHRQTVIVSS